MGSDEAADGGILKLPFIDFSKPLSSSGYRDSLKSQVREALEAYGCFEASMSDEAVLEEMQRDVYSSLVELFDLPLSTKQSRRFAVGETTYKGYLGHHPQYPSAFESFGIDDPDAEGEIEGFEKSLWGQGSSSFSKSIQTLLGKVRELDHMVRRIIVESYGLENYLDEHMSSTAYHLRVMKYEAPKSKDSELALRCHTDKCLITTLCQNEVGGLEVQTKKGEWVRFQSTSPGSFLVLAGDSLRAWMNGRVHSPYHRVMMSGNEPKYSLGLFTGPKADCVVKAAKELIDDQHPLQFNPFIMKEYFALAHGSVGREEPAPLETYYGV